MHGTRRMKVKGPRNFDSYGNGKNGNKNKSMCLSGPGPTRSPQFNFSRWCAPELYKEDQRFLGARILKYPSTIACSGSGGVGLSSFALNHYVGGSNPPTLRAFEIVGHFSNFLPLPRVKLATNGNCSCKGFQQRMLPSWRL